MKIGYACTTLCVPGTAQKTCRMKNANEKTLREIIDINLRALKKSVAYNLKYNIELFRISSDLIPFGSSPVNTLDWKQMFSREFQEIGKMINEGGMRVSMHPGQYTVLNSPNAEVVKNAIWDLDYHCGILDALGVGSEHKLILHVGGIYGNKMDSTRRFIEHYQNLSETIKNRLIIENDEKCFSTQDVLSLSAKTGIPVVYDNLHELINHGGQVDHASMIRQCALTWNEKDGRPKIHYAQQEEGRREGAHAQSVRSEQFLAFYKSIKSMDIDMMLEVKDKNLSALKCIYLTQKTSVDKIKEEWNKYRYAVLERSPFYYQLIELDLSGDEFPNIIRFYRNIESALRLEAAVDSFELAVQLLWDESFYKCGTDEKTKLESSVKRYKEGRLSSAAVKNLLYRTAQKFCIDKVLESYYFLY